MASLTPPYLTPIPIKVMHASSLAPAHPEQLLEGIAAFCTHLRQLEATRDYSRDAYAASTRTDALTSKLRAKMVALISELCASGVLGDVTAANTFSTAVTHMDRFLARNSSIPLTQDNLCALVGACIMVAVKTEELTSPELAGVVKSLPGVTVAAVHALELALLDAFEHNVDAPTPALWVSTLCHEIGILAEALDAVTLDGSIAPDHADDDATSAFSLELASVDSLYVPAAQLAMNKSEEATAAAATPPAPSRASDVARMLVFDTSEGSVGLMDSAGGGSELSHMVQLPPPPMGVFAMLSPPFAKPAAGTSFMDGHAASAIMAPFKSGTPGPKLSPTAVNSASSAVTTAADARALAMSTPFGNMSVMSLDTPHERIARSITGKSYGRDGGAGSVFSTSEEPCDASEVMMEVMSDFDRTMSRPLQLAALTPLSPPAPITRRASSIMLWPWLPLVHSERLFLKGCDNRLDVYGQPMSLHSKAAQSPEAARRLNATAPITFIPTCTDLPGSLLHAAVTHGNRPMPQKQASPVLTPASRTSAVLAADTLSLVAWLALHPRSATLAPSAMASGALLALAFHVPAHADLRRIVLHGVKVCALGAYPSIELDSVTTSMASTGNSHTNCTIKHKYTLLRELVDACMGGPIDAKACIAGRVTTDARWAAIQEAYTWIACLLPSWPGVHYCDGRRLVHAVKNNTLSSDDAVWLHTTSGTAAEWDAMMTVMAKDVHAASAPHSAFRGASIGHASIASVVAASRRATHALAPHPSVTASMELCGHWTSALFNSVLMPGNDASAARRVWWRSPDECEAMRITDMRVAAAPAASRVKLPTIDGTMEASGPMTRGRAAARRTAAQREEVDTEAVPSHKRARMLLPVIHA